MSLGEREGMAQVKRACPGYLETPGAVVGQVKTNSQGPCATLIEPARFRDRGIRPGSFLSTLPGR